MALINFFSEDVDFKLARPKKIVLWIKSAVAAEKRKVKLLNIIFCSDDYLIKINKQYLNHKTLTDIITFDQSEDPLLLEGDIFISVPRVRDNATKFKVTLNDELHRVIIHGVLHLIGYGDKSNSSKKQMREKEDAYLSLR